MAMSKLTRGLVELNVSRTSLAVRGVGRIAECLQTMPSIYSTLRRLDLSFNCVKGEEIGVSFALCFGQTYLSWLKYGLGSNLWQLWDG